MSSEAWRWHHDVEASRLGPSTVTTSGWCIQTSRSTGVIYHAPHEYETIFNPHTCRPDNQRCIHCGHTKNLHRKDDNTMRSFKEYKYVVIKRKKGNASNDYLLDGTDAWSALKPAKERVDDRAEEDSEYLYGVAEITYFANKHETIKDTRDKEYTIEKTDTHISVKAPCGESQTFSRKDLQAMLNND